MIEANNERPMLKQFGELMKEDFVINPVWVQCHIIDYDEEWYDETDEETFRPWTGKLPVIEDFAMFLVEAEFTFVDGTNYSGFITPGYQKNESDLGFTQPHIFVDGDKMVGFWMGSLPSDMVEGIKKSSYSNMQKRSENIFPILFKSKSGLSSHIVSGEILGFYTYNKGEVSIEL